MLDEEGTTVTNVVDARGQELDDIDVDLDKHFLADDPKEEGLLGEPDEDHSGYTGNEGATIERVRLLACRRQVPAPLFLCLLLGSDGLYLIAQQHFGRHRPTSAASSSCGRPASTSIS